MNIIHRYLPKGVWKSILYYIWLVGIAVAAEAAGFGEDSIRGAGVGVDGAVRNVHHERPAGFWAQVEGIMELERGGGADGGVDGNVADEHGKGGEERGRIEGKG